MVSIDFQIHFQLKKTYNWKSVEISENEIGLTMNLYDIILYQPSYFSESPLASRLLYGAMHDREEGRERLGEDKTNY